MIKENSFAINCSKILVVNIKNYKKFHQDFTLLIKNKSEYAGAKQIK